MAIIKCKMCGGDLNILEGQSVAECEYCGSRQTVPTADNEKKLTLFARANRLRSSCEFDKAAGIYESIVADFPEEAESYWGLVLCKYGIEYVDDPATGKKIPTCHRSSFESVIDDANLELALENADAVARRVYREEAKQLEEIRKGIIAVSSNEEPYDIFICYKETDEKGDRTLDSVLAQDIYDALTDKGYRTFFARITLEDKLGQEYEPYIFAALNSAKIMLAIGTDYEYYNAVWVKNEWSRFLKLMTTDKSKHLIPCYKGIDAYDMPKEFARLQAQDLGKMGAIQDILRGVEKLIPKAKPVTVVQEKVVVGGSGNNKIASLLDRGNMALEDGDWAKADSFFEDVLNNDSKNAQAYLGKTLAQEKCRTIDAFVRKRKGQYNTVRAETWHLTPKENHIREAMEQYSIPGYVDKNRIRKLYDFDLSYNTEVPDRKQQYRNEQAYWTDHKQLSRAEKFAVGAVAENLAAEKKTLFAFLSDWVQKAEAAEKAAREKLQTAYEAHIAQADAKAERMYREGLELREKEYQKWLLDLKNDPDLSTYQGAKQFFESQGDFKDCRALAEHCGKRIADILAEQARLEAEKKAAQEAEAQRQQALAAKLEAQRKARNKRNAILSAIAAVLVIAVIVVMTTVVIPNSKLSKAQAHLDAGEYQAAYDILVNLNGYKNSAELLEQVGQHGMYVVTSAYQDDYDYDDDDYNITFTYNDKGMPLTYDKVDQDGDVYVSWQLEYTWYESSNLASCTIYRSNNTVACRMEFYDSPDSRVAYVPGNGLHRNSYWYTSNDLVFYGASHIDGYNSDGEASYSYRYNEDSTNAAWICTYDDQGRLVKYHTQEGDSETLYTYNKKGEIDVRTYVEDRSEPDSVWNDEYEYRYTYTNGRLTTWEYDWIYDVQERREDYTYDASGNVTKIILASRDEYAWGEEYLHQTYTYTLNYEWLDFAGMEDQMADYYAEAEQKAQLRDLEAAMGASLSDAYALAQNMADGDTAKELVDLCETYYPYCGTFTIVEYEDLPIESDFYWDGENLYWVCKQGDGILMAEIGEVMHTYFQEPTLVEDGKALEEFDGTDARISFENGKIVYTWGYYASVELDQNNNIVARDDYTEAWTLTMVPQK